MVTKGVSLIPNDIMEKLGISFRTFGSLSRVSSAIVRYNADRYSALFCSSFLVAATFEGEFSCLSWAGHV